MKWTKDELAGKKLFIKERGMIGLMEVEEISNGKLRCEIFCNGDAKDGSIIFVKIMLDENQIADIKRNEDSKIQSDFIFDE